MLILNKKIVLGLAGGLLTITLGGTIFTTIWILNNQNKLNTTENSTNNSSVVTSEYQVSKISNNINILDDNTEGLDGEYDLLKNKSNKLKKDYENFEKTVDILEEKINFLISDKKNWLNTIGVLETEIPQEKITNLNDRISQIEVNSNLLDSKFKTILTEYQNDFTLFKAKINNFKINIESKDFIWKNQLNDLNEKIIEINESIKYLDINLDNLVDQQFDILEAKLNIFDTEINDLKNQKTILNNNVIKWNENINLFLQKINNFFDIVEEWKIDQIQYSNNLNSKINQVINIDNEIEILSNNNSSLQSDLLNYQNSIDTENETKKGEMNQISINLNKILEIFANKEIYISDLLNYIDVFFQNLFPDLIFTSSEFENNFIASQEMEVGNNWKNLDRLMNYLFHSIKVWKSQYNTNTSEIETLLQNANILYTDFYNQKLNIDSNRNIEINNLEQLNKLENNFYKLLVEINNFHATTLSKNDRIISSDDNFDKSQLLINLKTDLIEMKQLLNVNKNNQNIITDLQNNLNQTENSINQDFTSQNQILSNNLNNIDLLAKKLKIIDDKYIIMSNWYKKYNSLFEESSNLLTTIDSNLINLDDGVNYIVTSINSIKDYMKSFYLDDLNNFINSTQYLSYNVNDLMSEFDFSLLNGQYTNIDKSILEEQGLETFQARDFLTPINFKTILNFFADKVLKETHYSSLDFIQQNFNFHFDFNLTNYLNNGINSLTKENETNKIGLRISVGTKLKHDSRFEGITKIDDALEQINFQKENGGVIFSLIKDDSSFGTYSSTYPQFHTSTPAQENEEFNEWLLRYYSPEEIPELKIFYLGTGTKKFYSNFDADEVALFFVVNPITYHIKFFSKHNNLNILTDKADPAIKFDLENIFLIPKETNNLTEVVLEGRLSENLSA